MNQLRVTLTIELKSDVIEEEGLDEEQVMERIEEHLFQAIGNRSHENWQYVKDVYTVSIGVS